MYRLLPVQWVLSISQSSKFGGDDDNKGSEAGLSNCRYVTNSGNRHCMLATERLKLGTKLSN